MTKRFDLPCFYINGNRQSYVSSVGNRFFFNHYWNMRRGSSFILIFIEIEMEFLSFFINDDGFRLSWVGKQYQQVLLNVPKC